MTSDKTSALADPQARPGAPEQRQKTPVPAKPSAPDSTRALLRAEELEVRLAAQQKAVDREQLKLLQQITRLTRERDGLQAQLAEASAAIETLQEGADLRQSQIELEHKISRRLLAFYNSDPHTHDGPAAPSFGDVLNSDTVLSHAALSGAARHEALALAETTPHSVSVVVPTYNRAVSIVRAVRSALEQSLPPHQVIIADDASTDQTLDILRDTFGDEVRTGQVVILPCEKGGVCKMRNEGLAVATGDIIAFLDSDNFWHPDHLLWAVTALQARQADSVYTAANIHHLNEDWSRVDSTPYDRTALLAQNFIDLNCFVHRTALYKAHGGFDTSLTRLVDWEYIIRLTKDRPALRIPVSTVEYFLDKDGLANISFVSQLEENATKIQLKHREEMRKHRIFSESHEARLDAALARMRSAPPEPQHPAPAAPAAAPPAPVKEAPLRAEAEAEPDQLPYFGGLELHVVLPVGMAIPRGLPTRFVTPRYIHLHGRDRWSEASADGKVTSILTGLPEGNYWTPDLRQAMPTAHQLASLTAATALTRIDLAIASLSLEPVSSVELTCFRNQVVLRHTQIENFVNGKVLGSDAIGKVLRLPQGPQPGTQNRRLATLLGREVHLDEASQYFGFDARPEPAAMRADPPLSILPKTKDTPRILVLAQKLAVGGVERNTIEITRQLSDSHECLYLTLEKIFPEQGSLCHQSVDACRNTIDLAEIGHHKIYPDLLGYLNTVYQPDNLWICNGSMWLAANASQVRDIFRGCGIVDQQVYDYEAGWINRYQEEGIQSFDRFIAINRKIHDKFVNIFKMDPDRIDLIYSAINAQRFREARACQLDKMQQRQQYGLPHDKTLLAFMGRLVDQKRPLDFLRIAQLSAKTPDLHFVLVGNGVLAPEVETFLANNKLPNVTWIKNVADTTNFWPAIDAYLVTSEYEGLPIALIEAISMGVPVFATDVGDIRFVLEKYKAGHVMDEIGNPDLFADCIQDKLAGLKAYAKELAGKGDDIIGFFSAEAISGQFAESFAKARSAAAAGE